MAGVRHGRGMGKACDVWIGLYCLPLLVQISSHFHLPQIEIHKFYPLFIQPSQFFGDGICYYNFWAFGLYSLNTISLFIKPKQLYSGILHTTCKTAQCFSIPGTSLWVPVVLVLQYQGFSLSTNPLSSLQVYHHNNILIYLTRKHFWLKKCIFPTQSDGFVALHVQIYPYINNC
jgi:hypothetical protein